MPLRTSVGPATAAETHAAAKDMGWTRGMAGYRFIIVDDHPLFRGALSQALGDRL